MCDLMGVVLLMCHMTITIVGVVLLMCHMTITIVGVVCVTWTIAIVGVV